MRELAQARTPAAAHSPGGRPPRAAQLVEPAQALRLARLALLALLARARARAPAFVPQLAQSRR